MVHKVSFKPDLTACFAINISYALLGHNRYSKKPIPSSLQTKDVYCGNTKLSAQQSWILMDAESVWVCRFAWLKISLLLNFMDVKAKVLPIIMEHNRICACHFSSRNGNNNSSLNLFRPRKCKWFSVCQEIEPLPPTPPASYIVWSDHLMPFDTVRKLWIYQ